MKTSHLAEVKEQGRASAMRSNYNPESLTPRGGTGKLDVTRMPMEWIESGTWRLPSGKALAEFALQAGFLAPLLFRAERFGTRLSAADAGSSKTARLGPAAKHWSEGSRP